MNNDDDSDKADNSEDDDGDDVSGDVYNVDDNDEFMLLRNMMK